MGAFDEILSRKFDRAVNKNWPLLRQFILLASSNKSNVDIQITDARDDVAANMLALQELVESSEREIWVLTNSLGDDCALTLPQPAEALFRWLEKDQSRVVNLLLKNAHFDYKSTEFYSELVERLGKKIDQQVHIRYTLCRDVMDCKFNAIASVSGCFKIKEIDDKNAEKVIMNFQDATSADSIIQDIKFLFSNNITSAVMTAPLEGCPPSISEEVTLINGDIEDVLGPSYEDRSKLIPEEIFPQLFPAA